MKVKYNNLDSAEEWIFFGVPSGCTEKATHQGLQLLLIIAMVTSLTTRLPPGRGLVKSSPLRKHDWRVWGNFGLACDGDDDALKAC